MNQTSSTNISITNLVLLVTIIPILIAILVYLVKRYLRSISNNENGSQINDTSQVENTDKNNTTSHALEITSSEFGDENLASSNANLKPTQFKIDSKLKKQLMNDFDRHFRKIRFKANNEKFKQDSCYICEEEFKWYEWVRQLRPCKCLFHEVCIIKHLETVSRNCPICNVDLNWESLDENKSYFSDERNSQADKEAKANLDITGLYMSPRTFAEEIVASMKDTKQEQSPKQQQDVVITPRTLEKTDLQLVKEKVRSKKKETAEIRKKMSDDLDHYSKNVIKIHTGSSEKEIENSNLVKNIDIKEFGSKNKEKDFENQSPDNFKSTTVDSFKNKISGSLSKINTVE